MNRFSRLVKENLLPFIIFVIIASACIGAWFFYHPSSPYHDRYSFVVSFKAVGTLSPGNRVMVRGIPRGEITKVELTDDAVYVTVKVLSITNIPKNSEFRLINSGLMGEREMSILTGDSREMVTPGDTLPGHFDEGMTGVSRKLTDIMGGMGEIRDTVRNFMDSLSGGSRHVRIERVTRKAHKLVDATKGNASEWKNEVQTLLEKCDRSLESATSALENISGRAGAKLNDIDKMLNHAQELLSKVQELKEQSANIIDRLAKGDNSAGLLLDKRAQFNIQLDKLLQEVDSLLENIKKSGLDINIDIF